MRDEAFKMTLGRQPPFASSWEPFFVWLSNHYIGRYWPSKRYERFLRRIEDRNRYRAGPRPWKPGRYQTSRWQPYTGLGRFSGLRESLNGAYYAERYTGERARPEDYLKTHGRPGEYDEAMARRWAKESWRVAA